MEDVINYMVRIFRRKYEEVRHQIERMIDYGTLDIAVLEEYSRLLKFKEWIDSDLGFRYFSLENARLILADKLNIVCGDLVLDVGSGDGWFSIQAAIKYSNAYFYGVELSEEYAEASEYAKIFGLRNTYFLYFNAYSMPFPSKKFDKAALFFSLANISQNTEDLNKLFIEIYRVLRDDGLIGISEPLLEDFPNNLGIILRNLYEHCSIRNETLLSLEQVVNSLKRTNFDIIHIEKIRLKSTGRDISEAKEYLEQYYSCRLPTEIFTSINTNKIWTRDDPPQYTIIIAKKKSM